MIVMRATGPMVLEPMRRVDISYEPYCMPHPAFGDWTRFHTLMTEIIDKLPGTGGKHWKEIAA